MTHHLPPTHTGEQPDRPGELGDGDALGLCLPVRQAPRQGGHCAPPAEPDPRPPAEDRHGRQDEEDGRAAAVHRQRPQEPQSHREPGRAQLSNEWPMFATPSS